MKKYYLVFKLNEYKIAIELLERSLIIVEKNEGFEHRYTASVVNSLAAAYNKSKNFISISQKWQNQVKGNYYLINRKTNTRSNRIYLKWK